MPVQLGSAYGKVVIDSSGVRTGVTSAQGSLRALEGTFNAVKGTVIAAGLGITAAVAGAGAAAVTMAASLDREMRNVNSIAKLPQQEFENLRGQVVKLSQEVPQSAEVLAKGLYDIQSSGFSTKNALTGANDALAILNVSARAASAGLTTTDVASKAITATLNAYGMGADQAQRVSDVLFRTVDRGVLTFEELAVNLGDVVGTANVAGVSIEELGAGFATMTKGGISAAESATALNQLMLSYIKPSEDATKLASKLGLEFSAQALQSKGLSGAITELVEKVGLYEIVATGADDKIKANIKSIDEQIRALERQKLATGDVTKAQKDAIEQQIRALEQQKRAIVGTDEAAKAARKSISDQIAALRDQKADVPNAADAINKQIQALRLQKSELLASKDANIDYNVVMAEMSKRTGLTAEQLAELFPNVRALRAALALTRGEGQGFAEDLKAMEDASGATNAAFAEQSKATTFQFEILRNKVGAILIQIGTAVLPIINRVMENIAKALESPEVKNAVEGIVVLIRMLSGASFADVLADSGKSMPDFIKQFGWVFQIVNFVKGTFIPTLQTIVGVVGNVFGKIVTLVSDILRGDFKGALANITVWLSEIFGNQFANDFYNTVLGIVNFITGTVIPGFFQFVEFLRTQVFPVVSAVFGWIMEHRSEILGVLAGIVAGFAAFQVISTVVGVITGIIAVIGSMGAAISAAGGIIAAIVAILGGPLTLAILAVSAIIGLFVAAWVNDWGNIREHTANVLAFIQNLITAVITGIQQFWADHGAEILAAWEKVWTAVQKAVETFISIVKPILEAFMAALSGDWYLFGQKMRESTDALWEAIKGIFNAAIPLLKEAAQKIIDAVVNLFKNTDWGAVGQGIIDGIVSALKAGVTAIEDAARAVAQAALDAAKGFLGIQSPSEVFKEQVGKNIGEGIRLGIADKLPAIQETLKGLLTNVPMSIQPTVNAPLGVGGGIGTPTPEKITYQVFIDGKEIQNAMLKVVYGDVATLVGEATGTAGG